MLSSLVKQFLSPDKDVSIECFPKVSKNVFQLPMVEANKALPVSEEVLDNLEIIVSKSDNTPIINTLYDGSTPFAHEMMSSMASFYTEDVKFLQDTQKILTRMEDKEREDKEEKDKEEEEKKDKEREEKDIQAIWSDFAENPEFLEKYCFMDWEPFYAWNQNYYFMQAISVVHGILPMLNMFITLLILLIPLGILWAHGICLSKDSYMECIKGIGGENQMFCHILKLMDCQRTFSFQNFFLFAVVAAIYGFQFYYNVIHTERFYRHFYQVVENLRKIKVFLKKTDSRMVKFEQEAKDLTTYDPFLVKMRKQQGVLKETLQEMNQVLPKSESGLYHDGIQMGYYFNVYHKFYSSVEIQQMVQYSISLNGYLDNMENVAHKLSEGKVHLAEFHSENQHNSIEESYYPAIAANNPVKNSLELDTQVILTGPNASGKTTWIKSVALNFLFSQQVGVGFYQSCKIPRPYRHFHSYMNIPDTSERDSLFEAESRRCKTILTQLETNPGQHLCIFDELFSGTNPKDATQAATSFLKYICKLPNRQQIDFLLTTHYIDVCHKMEKFDDETGEYRPVKNYKMNCIEQNDSIEMSFQCIPGISEIHGAIYVLEKMNFPQEMLRESKVG